MVVTNDILLPPRDKVCPCQSDLRDWKKENLVVVGTRDDYLSLYMRGDFKVAGWNSSPPIPTYDGEEIVKENFPESDFICTECGKKFFSYEDVRPLSEKGDKKEVSLTDEDWEIIQEALSVHNGLTDDEQVIETLNKVKSD